MTRRTDELAASMAASEQRLLEIERHLDTMKTVLMVREPSSTIAAEAYDGLRKQVAASMSERVAHLNQLVQLVEALAAGVDGATLARLVGSWSDAAGLVQISDPAAPGAAECFELVEDLGGPLECVAPAYVDSTTGRVMRTGKSRRAAPHAARVEPEPGPDRLDAVRPGPLDGGEQA